MIKKRKPYTIYLGADMFAAGTKLAKERGLNLSWMLNELLRKEVEKNAKRKKN